ncbi:MAG: DNA adenine methylase [Chloroflexi bacterium]|nr:DNA adenine methylase [Chloroflexota bacterium]
MRNSPTFQLPLFKQNDLSRVVNVASVPFRSPFRYPGGKTWLVPRIRQWLLGKKEKPNLLVEPFAGGAIVGLTAAFERLAQRVLLAERDPSVAAVWKTILNADGEWLAERIVNFELTPRSVDAVLERDASTTRDLAFQTILRNRVNRGGILADGAGRVKHGENGKGLSSRWYPDTLRRRILDIVQIRERISIVEGDGILTIQENASRPDAVFFIDPPYTAAGKRAGRRLYTYSDLDHPQLFSIAAAIRGDFLMTYDTVEEIEELALQYGFDRESIAMKNTHHARMTELLIGPNLVWLR